MKIVFLGSDGIALPMLEWIAGPGRAIGEIVAVYTQPDRPIGRGQKVQPNAIKTWAQARALPVFQPEKLTEETRQAYANLGADLGLVMAYGHILKDAFIATPKLGTVNLHASLLPSLRGASPIQTAVATGCTETAVSLMRIVRELDAGPVADLERVPIGPRDTALEVEQRLAAACVPLIQRTLPRIADGTLEFVAQDGGRATFCRRLTREDGVVDFAAPARTLAARINGLYPWPSCSVAILGQPVKLGLADASAEAVPSGAAAGAVLGQDSEALRVATGDGVLRLLRLQRPGARMMPAPDFLRGYPVPAGTVLASTPMPALVR